MLGESVLNQNKILNGFRHFLKSKTAKSGTGNYSGQGNTSPLLIEVNTLFSKYFYLKEHFKCIVSCSFSQ